MFLKVRKWIVSHTTGHNALQIFVFCIILQVSDCFFITYFLQLNWGKLPILRVLNLIQEVVIFHALTKGTIIHLTSFWWTADFSDRSHVKLRQTAFLGFLRMSLIPLFCPTSYTFPGVFLTCVTHSEMIFHCTVINISTSTHTCLLTHMVIIVTQPIL